MGNGCPQGKGEVVRAPEKTTHSSVFPLKASLSSPDFSDLAESLFNYIVTFQLITVRNRQGRCCQPVTPPPMSTPMRIGYTGLLAFWKEDSWPSRPMKN